MSGEAPSSPPAVQHPNGADAPIASCLHVAAARGSFGALGGLVRMAIIFRISIAALSMCIWAAEVAAQTGRPDYERALEDIETRVRGRTGPGGQSCGNLFRRPGENRLHTAAEVREAIACVRSGASFGTPTWFVLGGHGFDSWVAEGLLASRYGAIEHYTYDSDPAGGGRVSDRARFDSGRCFGAHVYERPNRGFSIECLNDPWRLVIQGLVLSVCAIATTLGVALARRSRRKSAAVVLVLGAALTAAGAGTLARLGGLRVDLALTAAVCLLVMGVLLVRCLRPPASLAA